MKILVVVAMVLALVGSAMARQQFSEQHPIVVFGQVLESVTVIDQGGPLNGFLGSTRFTHALVAQDPQSGKVYAVSSYGAQSDGLGKTFINAAVSNPGAFNPLWPATQVSQSVNGANASAGGGAANSSSSSGIKAKFSQSQYQSQSQAQAQSQSLKNTNYNTNVNTNINTLKGNNGNDKPW